MTEEEINDRIDKWHDGGGFGQELHEYLGLTWNQYAVWIYCFIVFDSTIADKLALNFSPTEIQKIKQTIIKDENAQKQS